MALTEGDSEDDIPLWSPNGMRIAFQAVRGDNFDIEMIDVADKRRTPLATAPEYDGLAAWSPDGSRIAFVSGRTGADALYVVNVGTGRIATVSAHPALNPHWRP